MVGDAPERRGLGAAVAGGARAARTDLVADPLAAGQGTDGDGDRREHRRHAVLDRADRPTLQRRGAGRQGQPAAHHLVASAADVVGGAAGGAAGGVGRAGAGRSEALDLPRGGGLDGREARPSGGGAARLGVPAAAPAEPADAAATPRLSRTPRSRPRAKKVRPLVSAVATAHPHATVELWATDEHRLRHPGLKPLLRRVWAPKGQRPTAVVQHRFRWRWLVGFVQPASGRTLFPLATSVSIPLFE